MIDTDFQNNERGTFTVWSLSLCLILFLLAGLSVDVWRAFDARRELNEIADTAARAGASEIDVEQRRLYGRIVLDPAQVETATQDSIETNSELQRVEVDSVNIDIDEHVNEVDVEIHSTFSFFLLKMLPGASDADVVARSSARPFQG